MIYLVFLLEEYFSSFIFGSKEERDLIFLSDPYLVEFRVMFMSPGTPNFNLEEDIEVVQFWVKLPLFPDPFWEDITNFLY